ncbi:MAG TPA: 2,4'-dihydroxyacetophenone dioxygenase family protein [Sphingobium sp.]|uniref:2,4'-dihydroxyacetophenone dioxygenase family protein n=1 Tax=Sphingobium sp. TaxID=1912891 RepID=UPI002ED4CEA0
MASVAQLPTQSSDPVEQVTLEYGCKDVHLDLSKDVTSPWIPWTPGTYLKHTMFDVRNNAWHQILRVDPGAKLGKHRHRGPVNGVVLEGGWKYAEYDWIARPGDIIRESPGVIHTLLAEPEGMTTFFTVAAALDFFDDDNNLTETMDVFWYINHYTSYCKKNGIPINQDLFF